MFRRLLRLIFRSLSFALAGLSLMLCAALATDWARSYSSAGELVVGWKTRDEPDPAGTGGVRREGLVTTFISNGGELETSAVHFADDGPPPTNRNPWIVERPDLMSAYADWGFGGRLFGLAETYPRGDLPAADSAFAARPIDDAPKEIPGLVVRGWVVRLPHWLPVLATALPPLAVFRGGWVRRRRKRRGLCVNCGYDLRASKDRCPECGELDATRSDSRVAA